LSIGGSLDTDITHGGEENEEGNLIFFFFGSLSAHFAEGGLRAYMVELWHSQPVLPGTTVPQTAGLKKIKCFFIFGPPIQTKTGSKTEYENCLD